MEVTVAIVTVSAMELDDMPRLCSNFGGRYGHFHALSQNGHLREMRERYSRGEASLATSQSVETSAAPPTPPPPSAPIPSMVLGFLIGV